MPRKWYQLLSSFKHPQELASIIIFAINPDDSHHYYFHLFQSANVSFTTSNFEAIDATCSVRSALDYLIARKKKDARRNVETWLLKRRKIWEQDSCCYVENWCYDITDCFRIANGHRFHQDQVLIFYAAMMDKPIHSVEPCSICKGSFSEQRQLCFLLPADRLAHNFVTSGVETVKYHEQLNRELKN